MIAESDGLIFAYILDGNGGGRKVGWEGIESWKPKQGLLWVHLDYSSSGTRTWLYDKSGLDDVICGTLSEEDSRPRCTTFQEGLLLGLRGVNLNPGADPEDMVGIRIWFEKSRIISTRRRRLLSISDMQENIEKKVGPESLGDFLVQISGRIMERMQEVIDNLEDSIAEVEDQIVTAESHELRTRLADLRRQAISLRRFLSPQREALTRLLTEKITWLEERDRIGLREVFDRLARYIEDLDEARDRAAVTQEELANRLAEQMNSKMYILAIVAAIFLPLGFLTGLLGINVGGIPGAESRIGFTTFVILLVIVVIFQILFFKKKKWL
jgi:zinc transporter